MSKNGYTEHERVQVKREFVRMLVRMKLDQVRSHFLMSFFEKYLKLSEQEEELFRQEMGKFSEKEVAVIMQLTTSWEEKARTERTLEVVEKMLLSGMDIDTVVKITDLDRAKVEELKKQLKH